MDPEIKKTSAEWLEEECVRIIDYDGWDRRSLYYSFNLEKITKQEFVKRLSISTICGKED